MSLNRCEQAVFDYWNGHPDERRHWQAKISDSGLSSGAATDLPRRLERELWDYLLERSQHVAALRSVLPLGSRRVSLLNLAELILRLWGPQPKPTPTSTTGR